MKVVAQGPLWQVIHADARQLPLEDASVDLVVTSPPYWSQRSYRDGGEHYDGQIGDEDTPEQYVAALVGILDTEIRRVLAGHGSLFLNLGDKFSGYTANTNTPHSFQVADPQARRPGDGGDRNPPSGPRSLPGLIGVEEKSLIGLPEMVKLEMIRRGWICRGQVVWAKSNPMPESVGDRFRRTHEFVFHFTKASRYFSNIDEIREPYSSPPAKAQRSSIIEQGHSQRPGLELDHDLEHNPLGRLPSDVWWMATEGLSLPAEITDQHGTHFAPFPMDLPRLPILGFTPSGYCVECGHPRRMIYEKRVVKWQTGHSFSSANEMLVGRGRNMTANRGADKLQPNTTVLVVVGEECGDGCEADYPTRPAVVLDPFGGSGTTAGVAASHGRHGISVDKSLSYCEIAAWRLRESRDFERSALRYRERREEASVPSSPLVEFLAMLPGVTRRAAYLMVQEGRVPLRVDQTVGGSGKLLDSWSRFLGGGSAGEWGWLDSWEASQ